MASRRVVFALDLSKGLLELFDGLLYLMLLCAYHIIDAGGDAMANTHKAPAAREEDQRLDVIRQDRLAVGVVHLCVFIRVTTQAHVVNVELKPEGAGDDDEVKDVHQRAKEEAIECEEQTDELHRLRQQELERDLKEGRARGGKKRGTGAAGEGGPNDTPSETVPEMSDCAPRPPLQYKRASF